MKPRWRSTLALLCSLAAGCGAAVRPSRDAELPEEGIPNGGDVDASPAASTDGGTAGEASAPTTAGSCTWVADAGDAMDCIEWGPAWTGLMSCTESFTYSPSACPTSMRVGRCVAMNSQGAAFAITFSAYPPTTLDEWRAACAASRGTFIPD